MRPKHLSTMSRLSALVACMACTLAIGACLPEPDANLDPDDVTDDVKRDSRSLLLAGTTKLWTANNRTIPMCWDTFYRFPNEESQIAMREILKQTITEGWINLLNLRITWEECPTSGPASHVRIMLRVGDDTYNGTTKALGADTLSTAAARAIPPPNDAPGLLMAFPSDWNLTQLRSLFLHEFGHILGFPDESCAPGASPDPTLVGPADPLSIMGLGGYCPQALGVLSPANVRAAHAIYGYGRSGTNDFNDDSRGDILWHDSSTHMTLIWSLSGSARFGRTTVVDDRGNVPRVGPPWSIAASADFDGDQGADLLWHNSQSNETKLWFMNGERIRYQATVVDQYGWAVFAGLPWNIVATSDFNGDGATDILWHNDTSNETKVWYMLKNQMLRAETIQDETNRNIFVGRPWTIAGTGDFNGDRKPDILWHNDSTNETQVWLMDGRKIMSSGPGRRTIKDEVGNNIFVGPPWRIAGTNDFNQDGSSDILWHDHTSGMILIWYMNGTSILRRVVVDAQLDGGGEPVENGPWNIIRH